MFGSLLLPGGRGYEKISLLSSFFTKVNVVRGVCPIWNADVIPGILVLTLKNKVQGFEVGVWGLILPLPVLSCQVQTAFSWENLLVYKNSRLDFSVTCNRLWYRWWCQMYLLMGLQCVFFLLLLPYLIINYWAKLSSETLSVWAKMISEGNTGVLWQIDLVHTNLPLQSEASNVISKTYYSSSWHETPLSFSICFCRKLQLHQGRSLAAHRQSVRNSMDSPSIIPFSFKLVCIDCPVQGIVTIDHVFASQINSIKDYRN